VVQAKNRKNKTNNAHQVNCNRMKRNMTLENNYSDSAVKSLGPEQKDTTIYDSSILLTDPALLQQHLETFLANCTGVPEKDTTIINSSILLTDPALLQQYFETFLANCTGVPEKRRPALICNMLALIAEAEGYPAGMATRISDPASKPEPTLPEEAPEKWSERTTGRAENPVAFIRRVYAPWLGKGLTRAHLSKIDYALYQAHAKWQERHPNDPKTTELKHLIPDRSKIATQRIEHALTDPESPDRLAAAQALATREYRRRFT
jgi:hypothetical protein